MKRNLLKCTMVSGILIVMIAGIVIRHIAHHADPIQFYSRWPFYEVSEQAQALTRKIYESWQGVLVKVKVAEDSRSKNCIRFVFIGAIPETAKSDILDRVADYMADVQRGQLWRLLMDSWEVFFCTQDTICSVYVSRLDGDICQVYGRDDIVFTNWEAVPNAEALIDMEMLEEMLCEIWEPMYPKGPRPITDFQINLPPYTTSSSSSTKPQEDTPKVGINR